MNILDFFTSYYGALYKQKTPKIIHAQIVKLTRTIANWVLPFWLEKKRDVVLHPQSDIIVSLTSFPERINNVWMVVECMLRQTLTPLKIILWLSKEQFQSEDAIPKSLKERVNDIFEIRLVDGDFRSHKKYYYTALEYPNAPVFLIDDDIFYPSDILKRSYNTFIKNKKSVVCNYARKIPYDNDGSHRPYFMWENQYEGASGDAFFFGSGGGTLFVPTMLHKDITNIEKAFRLTPLADDIWLNTMVRLAGLNIIVQNNGKILPIFSKSQALSKVNLYTNKNDEQIVNVELEYGKLFNIQRKS